MKRLKSFLPVLGPGVFAVGYTIGTGSVTAMAKAGADYGLGLLWALALSCAFSGLLMEAYGRIAAVTRETALMAMRRHLPCGRLLAILVFVGVVIGQYTCLGGILTLTSGAISEVLGGRVPPFAIAVGISAVMYALLTTGRYSSVEFAAAASALKHSIEHDFNLISVAEAEALAAGDGTGRVRR